MTEGRKKIDNPDVINKLTKSGLYPREIKEATSETQKSASDILCRIVIGSEAQAEANGFSLENLQSDVQEVVGNDGLSTNTII